MHYAPPRDGPRKPHCNRSETRNEDPGVQLVRVAPRSHVLIQVGNLPLSEYRNA